MHLLSKKRLLLGAVLLLACLILLPILLLFSSWLQIDKGLWQHLLETSLFELVRNTFYLMLGVGAGVACLGVGLAYLVTRTEYPGRRFFEWAFMLPLAIPAYVLAFVSIALYDYSGALQTHMRDIWGLSTHWFPPIRSTGGVIFVLVLALYPYVYLLARQAFLRQKAAPLEAARLMGLNPWQRFFRVTLPMARPAIVAGVALALMEALADFGAVSIFNFDTFTTAIYKSWIGFFDINTAAQLSTLLMLFVVFLLLAEKGFRGRAEFAEAQNAAAVEPQLLNGWQSYFAQLLSWGVVTLAFLIPIAQLILWLFDSEVRMTTEALITLSSHTLALGAVAALLTLLIALIFALAKRRSKKAPWLGAALSFSTMGYAVPGSVLAIAIMVFLSHTDNAINAVILVFIDNGAPRPWLMGTLVGLLLAYCIRFLRLAFGPIDAAFKQLNPRLEEAARLLGESSLGVMRRVSLPLVGSGCLSAYLLVMVEVFKEMPATLLIRPFGWDTLAVKVYELTSEGEWERAATPALLIVLVGLIPLMILMRQKPMEKRRELQ